MFELGDLVRLNGGRTPMMVIEVSGNYVRAKYANNHDYPIRKEDFDRPYTASGTYRRTYQAFTPWDGDHFDNYLNYDPSKKAKQMSKMNVPMRYGAVGRTHALHGTLLSRTSKGDLVLEMDNGSVKVFNPDEVERILPFTFSAEELSNSNNEISFGFENETARVEVGEILLSDSGKAYLVTKIDTQTIYPRHIFTGSRITLSDL